MKKVIFIILASICVKANAQINVQNTDSIIDLYDKSKTCGFCCKGNHGSESPYEFSFKQEAPFFAASLGLLTSGLIIRENSDYDNFTLDELSALDASQINSFDRGVTENKSGSALTMSDVLSYGSIILPLYFLSNHNTGKDLSSLAILGAEVFAITNTLSLNAKFISDRTRPLTYNPEFSLEKRMDKTNKLSFFSGHTANASALFIFTAKVMHDYHPNMTRGHKIGMWTLAFGVPAYTGYLRVKGGKHFYTDVITGYAVGTFVGWLVPHLHKKENDKLSIAPFNSGNGAGLTLTLRLD